MKFLPCRLEDTPHILRVIKDFNEKREVEEHAPDIIMCTWDIEAMFPNINNQLGIKACSELLDKREKLIPSTKCIVEAVKISLEENIAQFDDKVVKQNSGTAMGPHHSCSYADIAIDYAIDQHVISDKNPWRNNIGLWSRFRDDIFCPWLGTEEELGEFDRWLNGLDPHLKFTLVASSIDDISFLDLSLCIVDKIIHTKIHSKLCDTHAYLLPSSCHPSHVCKNIPKGVMQRVKRNCSDQASLTLAYKEYTEHLQVRNYSDEIIQEAIDRAESTPRNKLMGLSEVESRKSTNQKFPLIIKFNPRLPPMSKYINEHLHILSITPETGKLFNKDSIFVSYKIEKNILSTITKNKLKSDIYMNTPIPPTIQPRITGDENLGCFKCGSCTLCKNFMIETKIVFSAKTNQTFRIKDRLTCQTNNVIYMIIDKLCPDIFYIGYTSDNMRTRWTTHKSHIKMNVKSCELTSHFIKTSSSIHKLDRSSQGVFTSQLSQQISIYLIERVKPIQGKGIIELLETRENFWQATLKSARLYGGINKRSNKKHTRN